MLALSEHAPSIRRRVASMVYDGILLFGVLAFGLVVPQIAVAYLAGAAASGVWIWLHLFALVGAYFLWFWHHGGQTLAMQTWKIALTGADRREPKLHTLVLRYVYAWPSVLCFGIGILWAVFDRERQFLHDRLAGTSIRTASVVQPTTASSSLPAEK